MKGSLEKALWLAVAVIGAAGHGGCAQPVPKDQFLDDWSRRVDTIGFVPVMPPREDLRVGDMFVSSVNPVPALSPPKQSAVASELVSGTRWSALPVLNELDQEYRQRPAWPQTPASFMRPLAGGRPSLWEEPQIQGSGSIFAPDEAPTRLRVVGVELFSTVSFTGADLEHVIPTEAAMMITGQADPTEMAVTLRAGSGESYSLSLDTVISLLVDPITDRPGVRYRLKQPYRDQLDFVADPVDKRVWLQVVTEVVYMRSADVSIRRKTATPRDDEVTAPELAQVATALKASSAPAPAETPSDASPPASEQPQAAEVQPSSTGPSETTAAESRSGLEALAATKLDPLYGAFVRAKAINEILAEMDVDDVPNGTMRFLSVTDESVALRRVWPRALAIGVRGLYLEVDSTTGDVLKSGAAHWPADVPVTP